VARTQSIGSGLDQPTISAWEASCDRETNGDETGEVRTTTPDNTAVTINAAQADGSPNPVTSRLILQVRAAERHDGTYESGFYMAWGGTGSSNGNLYLQTNYITIDGIEFQAPDTTNYPALKAQSYGGWVIRNCLFTSDTISPTNAQYGCFLRYWQNADIEVYNNRAFGLSGGGRGFYLLPHGTDSTVDLYFGFNTVYDCDVGIEVYANGSTGGENYGESNCSVCTDAWDGGSSPWDGGAYNLSSNSATDAHMPSSNGYTDDSSIFVTASTDPDLDLAAAEDGNYDRGASAPTLGSNWSAVDIHGDARSDYDVGSDEIVAAAGANPKGPLGHPIHGPLGGPV
jgi:hypothetical protein